MDEKTTELLDKIEELVTEYEGEWGVLATCGVFKDLDGDDAFRHRNILTVGQAFSTQDALFLYANSLVNLLEEKGIVDEGLTKTEKEKMIEKTARGLKMLIRKVVRSRKETEKDPKNKSRRERKNYFGMSNEELQVEFKRSRKEFEKFKEKNALMEKLMKDSNVLERLKKEGKEEELKELQNKMAERKRQEALLDSLINLVE